MEIITRFKDLLTLGVRQVFIVAVVAWALLLLPKSTAEFIGIYGFYTAYRLWIGLVAFVATLYIGAVLLLDAGRWALKRAKSSDPLFSTLSLQGDYSRPIAAWSSNPVKVIGYKLRVTKCCQQWGFNQQVAHMIKTPKSQYIMDLMIELKRLQLDKTLSDLPSLLGVQRLLLPHFGWVDRLHFEVIFFKNNPVYHITIQLSSLGLKG